MARIDRGRPFDLLIRGRLLGWCDDHGGALRDFNRVIALAPKWHFGYAYRGRAHLALRDHDRALLDFNRAIELGPYFAVPYAARADLYYRQGRFEKALADLKQALELDPGDFISWDRYGSLLFEKGRIEKALTAIDKALELVPSYPDSHVDRGSLLAHLGRCDEAAAELRKAEEVAMGDLWPHRGIAEAYLSFFYYSCPDHYDLPEALRHLQIAYEGSPTDTQALALLRKGDYSESKRIYLELFEETPDGTSWFPLAICLWHLGEKAEARRFYDRSVIWMDERLPDSPMFIKMRQEAAELLGIQSPEP
jgi:tetratricopeptide (TPR) repeat protein